MLPTLKLTYAWKLRKILLKFDYNVLNIVQIKNVNVFQFITEVEETAKDELIEWSNW